MNYVPPPDKQAYYEQVWHLVRQIPGGNVATYGQLAQMLAAPDSIDIEDYKVCSPRWVGNALAACPGDVPWQRVINSQGKISSQSESQRQRELLENEGLVFVKDKLNLALYQWGNSTLQTSPQQETLF
jgi:methylated-DNA-protein-cysteine methyltransferase related protein